jgi:predicted dehydrogenase
MTGLIVGYGSIGRRHAANLRRLDPAITVVLWRREHGVRAEDADDHTHVVTTLAEALATRPDFAIICTPAPLHVETARALAERGIHVMVEKPLSDQLTGVDELIRVCRERAVTLLVAYNLRFHRPLQHVREAVLSGAVGRVLAIRAEVGQYLPDWRPATDYRVGTTARRATGGGVLLELSHEIDYVRWLGGEITEVTAMVDRVSDLEIDVEDCADITVRFASGAMGSIHLDMVQRAPVRGCRVIGSDGTVTWDGLTGVVSLYSAASGRWTPLSGTQGHDRNDMYLAELAHFLECVAGRSAPTIPGEEGRRVLELALAARRSSEDRKAVAV